MIFFFYNFCQFSSGALLLDIRLIQKQSFYLVEKTGEAQKILQQIVHSKLFYSCFSIIRNDFPVKIFANFLPGVPTYCFLTNFEILRVTPITTPLFKVRASLELKEISNLE